MGASHIRVRLDEPFLGVRDFHSTNGSAVFSPDGERLLVWDACVLLRLEFGPLLAPDWRAGFGPANDGLLPSVHRPYHDALFG